MFEVLMTAWIDRVLSAAPAVPAVPSSHNPQPGLIDRHRVYKQVLKVLHRKYKDTGCRRYSDAYSRVLYEGAWLLDAAYPQLGRYTG